MFTLFKATHDLLMGLLLGITVEVGDYWPNQRKSLWCIVISLSRRPIIYTDTLKHNLRCLVNTTPVLSLVLYSLNLITYIILLINHVTLHLFNIFTVPGCLFAYLGSPEARITNNTCLK